MKAVGAALFCQSDLDADGDDGLDEAIHDGHGELYVGLGPWRRRQQLSVTMASPTNPPRRQGVDDGEIGWRNAPRAGAV